MKNHAFFSAYCAYFPNWFNGTNFVIGKHHGYKNRIITNHLFHLFRRYEAIFVHIQIGNAKTLFFQRLAGMKHSMMLYFCRDDMLPFLLMRIRHAFDGPVVAFRGPRGKEYLTRHRANGLRNLLPGMIHCLLGFPCIAVYAGWVAKILSKIRGHFRQYFRLHIGCCRIVHINVLLFHHIPSRAPQRLLLFYLQHLRQCDGIYHIVYTFPDALV